MRKCSCSSYPLSAPKRRISAPALNAAMAASATVLPFFRAPIPMESVMMTPEKPISFLSMPRMEGERVAGSSGSRARTRTWAVMTMGTPDVTRVRKGGNSVFSSSSLVEEMRGSPE